MKISFYEKKPPGIMGYVDLMMYAPRVCGLSEHWLEVIQKRKRERKKVRGRKERMKKKRYKCELRRRIFGAEPRSMGLVPNDYPKCCEGDRLLQ